VDSLFEQVGSTLDSIFNTPVVRLLTTAFVAYIALVWLASAYWVLQDMRRRHHDPALPYLAAAGVIIASPVLFPLALIVYRIIRPGETFAEARERELTERLEQLEHDLALACPTCSRSVEEDWLVCPACRTRLAHLCVSCGRSMGLDWTLCGWCGAEFGRPVLPERLPKAVRHAWARDRQARDPLERKGEGRAARPARALEPG